MVIFAREKGKVPFFPGTRTHKNRGVFHRYRPYASPNCSFSHTFSVSGLKNTRASSGVLKRG